MSKRNRDSILKMSFSDNFPTKRDKQRRVSFDTKSQLFTYCQSNVENGEQSERIPLNDAVASKIKFKSVKSENKTISFNTMDPKDCLEREKERRRNPQNFLDRFLVPETMDIISEEDNSTMEITGETSIIFPSINKTQTPSSTKPVRIQNLKETPPLQRVEESKTKIKFESKSNANPKTKQNQKHKSVFEFKSPLSVRSDERMEQNIKNLFDIDDNFQEGIIGGENDLGSELTEDTSRSGNFNFVTNEKKDRTNQEVTSIYLQQKDSLNIDDKNDDFEKVDGNNEKNENKGKFENYRKFKKSTKDENQNRNKDINKEQDEKPKRRFSSLKELFDFAGVVLKGTEKRPEVYDQTPAGPEMRDLREKIKEEEQQLQLRKTSFENRLEELEKTFPGEKLESKLLRAGKAAKIFAENEASDMEEKFFSKHVDFLKRAVADLEALQLRINDNNSAVFKGKLGLSKELKKFETLKQKTEEEEILKNTAKIKELREKIAEVAKEEKELEKKQSNFLKIEKVLLESEKTDSETSSVFMGCEVGANNRREIRLRFGAEFLFFFEVKIGSVSHRKERNGSEENEEFDSIGGEFVSDVAICLSNRKNYRRRKFKFEGESDSFVEENLGEDYNSAERNGGLDAASGNEGELLFEGLGRADLVLERLFEKYEWINLLNGGAEQNLNLGKVCRKLSEICNKMVSVALDLHKVVQFGLKNKTPLILMANSSAVVPTPREIDSENSVFCHLWLTGENYENQIHLWIDVGAIFKIWLSSCPNQNPQSEFETDSILRLERVKFPTVPEPRTGRIKKTLENSVLRGSASFSSEAVRVATEEIEFLDRMAADEQDL